MPQQQRLRQFVRERILVMGWLCHFCLGGLYCCLQVASKAIYYPQPLASEAMLLFLVHCTLCQTAFTASYLGIWQTIPNVKPECRNTLWLS